jgi:hypothetical protein
VYVLAYSHPYFRLRRLQRHIYRRAAWEGCIGHNLHRPRRVDKTYADEQSRHRSQHGQRKEGRDDLGWVLGVGAVRVGDRLALAVAEWLLVDNGRRVGVCFDRHREDGFV